MNIRPFMAGIAYTWLHDKLSLSPSITAGYSFNSGSLDDDYLAAIGASGVDLADGEQLRAASQLRSVVLRRAQVIDQWPRRLSFHQARITLTTRSDTISDRWDASSFTISAGFIVYPFRR